jgi:hypothetical protein
MALEMDYGDSNYEKIKKASGSDFELKTIFSFINALEPTNSLINIEETPKVIAEESFSPTMKAPDIEVTDKLGRDYSIWYKPVVYYPKDEKTESMMVDFLMSKGKSKGLYDLDSTTLKELTTHEFITGSMIREFSMKLLSKIKPVHIILFVRENFSANDLKQINDAAFFLRPSRILLVSEKYIPNDVKMNLPINAQFVENAGMNIEKFKETVKKML